MRALPAKVQAVGGLCFEVLVGTWEPDQFVDEFFLIGNDLLPVLYCEINYTELGQPPTSQVRSRDTNHLRRSNSAAKTLSLVEHTLSKFGGDPCPVRQVLAAAVNCYV